MLKIGDFSRLSQVPVKTLRYYDEIGLLKSNRVDPMTGYRYYAFEQLPRLNRILALKELGLSLEQITRILEEDLSADQLRGMLRLRQAQLENQMQSVQEQMTQVETRLARIAQEGKMPDYEVVLRTVPAMLVATRRANISSYETLRPAFESTFGDLCAYVMQQGGKFAGRGMVLWHDDLDAEAAMPICARIAENAEIKVRAFDEEQMACVVHQGAFEGLAQAFESGFKWSVIHGYCVSGPIRSFYLNREEDRPGDPVVELQFPVHKEEKECEP